MNTRNKKALYESIMKSVSKTVKRKLNESHDYKSYLNDLFAILNDNGDKDVKENVLNLIYILLRDLQGDVSDLADGDISWDSLNKKFSNIIDIIDKQQPYLYTDDMDMK